MLVGYFIVAYLYFVYLRPRHVTVLRKIFTLFGWVFVLCGTTHALRTLKFLPWEHDTGLWLAWFIGIVNIGSAIITALVLLAMVPMIPAIMKFPTASAMSKANVELRQEISDLIDRNAKLATVDNLKAVENITCAIRAIRQLSEKEGG